MAGYFGSGSGSGLFTPQKPGPLNIGGGTGGTGLFAQRSPGGNFPSSV